MMEVSLKNARALVLQSLVAALLLCQCASTAQVAQEIPRTSATGCNGEQTPVCTVEAGPSVRLLLLGDAGDADSEHLPETLQRISDIGDFDAFLLLGDNAYECGFEDTQDPLWGQVIAPLLAFERPIFPVLGNHDYGSRGRTFRCRFSNPAAQVQKSATPGYENWRFPARNYIVRHPLIELIMFDSTPLAKGWPEGEAARRHVLEALAQPKTTPWRAVVGHHVLYSCGRHGGADETKRMRSIEAALVEGDVDFYISGHEHQLEIGSAGRPWFVISGAGSRVRRASRCPASMPAKAEAGFMILELDESQAALTAICNRQAEPCMQKLLVR